jgi:hypothetical protein
MPVGITWGSARSLPPAAWKNLWVEKEFNQHHIDYVIPVIYVEKQWLHSQFIACKCILHWILLHGTQVKEKWSMVPTCINVEKTISILEKVRQWKEEGKETVPLFELVELLIPCILHLENCIGEKMITIILQKALSDFHGWKEVFINRMDTFFSNENIGNRRKPIAVASTIFEGFW